MSRTATLIVVSLASAAIGATVLSPAVVRGQDAAAREAADRAQIEALMWRYVRALDTLDADAYVANYTPDGRFGNTKGHAALRKMIEDLARQRAEAAKKGEPRPPMYHVITNSYVEFVGRDRAIYRSYWMTVFGAQGQNTAPRIVAAGRGIDHLVRVDGKWLIESRDVAPTEE